MRQTDQSPAFVAYYRVSTDKQGRSGLGLEAQRETVARTVERERGRLVAEFVEVESGADNSRPRLAEALASARAHGAVLIVAKLDRLTRDAQFLLSIVDGTGEAGLRFCDFPDLPAGPFGKLMVTMLAAFAEFERGMISQRTRDALQAAKARGVQLGNPQLKAGSAEAATVARKARQTKAKARAADVMVYVRAAQKAGASSLREIAEALEARGVRTARGGQRWSPSQVARVIESAGA